MRRWIIVVLAALMLVSAAGAESAQKAPDFLMEGYDGDVTGRVWDSNVFFSRLQEITGVSFQFTQHTDKDRWAERKKELEKGENLPDVLFKAELTDAEIRTLYEAGRIIDLSPYLEQYAPDLWKLLEDHPEWKKSITLADGAIPVLPAINTLQSNDVMWINATWLRRLGLETPTTAEELTEVLRAFKEKDPNANYQQDEIPLSFVGMWELRFLGHAFGLCDNDYYISAADGQVTSSLTSDQNRAFLSWLNKLWEEGLLDHNGFSTTDSIRQITDEKAAIPYGMLLSSNVLTVLPAAAADQYAVLMPLESEGKQVYRDLLGDVVRGTFAITSACKEPEKLVAWVNGFYTEEISRLASYGQEGEEYLWNEDNYWEWSDTLENVANAVLPENTLSEGGVAPGLVDVDFQLKYREETTRNTIQQLSQLKEVSVLPFPQVMLSAEDEARVAEIQLELSRYVERAMARFVTGDIPLDDEQWEFFCRTAEEKGLTEMIAIWQKYV